MHETTNGKNSVFPPMAPTPGLDLLKILARTHDLEARRDNSFPGPWLLSSGASLLWLLSETLLFGKIGSTPDFKPIVEALRSFHAASQKQMRANHDQVYSEFEALESTLRKQSAAVDRRLRQSATSQTTSKAFLHAVQQTLFVQCACRGKTAARFRIVNRTGKSSSVNFCPRFTAESGMPEAALTFEPNSLYLEAGQAATCKAIIDLSRCPDSANKAFEMGAEIYLNTELTLKLFICVEVYDEDA
jgi:hypothetical protein